MTSKKNNIEDHLNYDLSKRDLNQLTLDQDTLDVINVAEASDKLAKEFFSPGYEKLLAYKKEHFRKLIADANFKSTHSEKQIKANFPKNLINIIISTILLCSAVYLLWINKQGQEITKEEVKQFALLSYESTGVLDANRGGVNTTNQLKVNYELLLNEKCNELIVNGIYPEQELWSKLYCAYLNNNEEMIDLYRSEIIVKKYSNYSKL